MPYKYKSLEELKRKKQLLKNDINQLEDLITFDNAKESLSAITNGFTDKYLTEIEDEVGQPKMAVNTDAVIQEIRKEVKEKVFSKSAVLGIAGTASRNGLVEDAISLGISGFVANYARKNIQNPNWKKKALGFAIIYLAPIAIRYARKQLDTYSKNKSVSSFEQLI